MVVRYKHRTTKGLSGPYQCDKEELIQLLKNKRFQECLYWLQAEFNGRVYHYDVKTGWRKKPFCIGTCL